jgi:TonB-dependent receptor
MNINKNNLRSRGLLFTSSMAALVLASNLSFAQDSQSSNGDVAKNIEANVDEVTVTGIRSSLQRSMEIKRNAKGVLDAISAEEMGKFPDSNLAEAMQRISGVSIDRVNGEGATVTVRGFDGSYNLVTLNGRQMPTSTLGDAVSAPSSRAFDFGNLASEAIAGLEVYKTGRASAQSGGIGSLINIKTSRPLDDPGFKATATYKLLSDESYNNGTEITPEISALVSATTQDNRFGVALSLSKQERKHSVNEALIGEWRDAYYGNEGNWGSIVGNPNHDVTNGPADDAVYRIPQSMAYVLKDFNTERLNGQLTLQYALTDDVTATFDYTYSKLENEARGNDVSIWFDHGSVASSWGDGNPAPINFYTEDIGQSDYSMGASLTANVNENRSAGANFEWAVNENLVLELDYHDSTAESRPNSPYGSSNVIGTRANYLAAQGIDFTNEMPIMQITSMDGFDVTSPALREPTGNVFHYAYFSSDIEQLQLKGRYEMDNDFIDSVDFGYSTTENSIRSAYGYTQNDTWSGVPGAGPDETPDELFTYVSLPDKFDGVGGSGSMIPGFHRFNFEQMADLLINTYNICGEDLDCRAPYKTDRRIMEDTQAIYAEFNKEFELFDRDASVLVGLRYEETEISSSALVEIPETAVWAAANEFYLGYSPDFGFETREAEYDHFLPSIDFDIDYSETIKLRASYSQTITRPTYADMQGGRSVDQLFRIGRGTGNRGNPALKPYESENWDISAEYYYGETSYASAGYFTKDVSNWIGTGTVDMAPFDVPHPGQGPRYAEAVAAVGNDAGAVRAYIIENYPETTFVDQNGLTVIRGILGEDPNVTFRFNNPTNSDREETIDGFEFAWQHDFSDTGLGMIANYTIVDGDAEYNNQLNAASGNQFALTGLSDSANLIAYYDKDGIQARIAYNWRDMYLSASGINPTYVEEHEQIDIGARYDFAGTGFSINFDGINITEEGKRVHGRDPSYVYTVSPGNARYYLGGTYKF